ncbi:hypothetical protein V2W45_1472785 [Cenococcum geophilum]
MDIDSDGNSYRIEPTDPKGSPHNIILKFIFKFTKKYLSIKEAAPNLTSAEQLTKLYIKPGRNQLPLPLHPDLNNIPIFWRLIKAFYGYKVSPDQPLQYLTLLPWIKDLSTITGFQQVARLYSLYYGTGKAFNKNSNYADARTFLKHYLLRHINVDTQAILKLSLKRKTAESIEYQKLSREIKNERQQNIKKNWNNKQAIINIERKDIKVTLESNNNRSAEYKRLIKVIITLPSILLEDKIYRRNNAINTVVDYYNVKEETAKALESVKLSLYKEKRLKIYFICLGNQKLLISKRIYRFYTLTTLIKHFQQAHLSKLL